MVQILPAIQRPRKKSFGEQLSAGVGGALDVYEEHYNEQQKNKALQSEAEQLKSVHDIDVAGLSPEMRKLVVSEKLRGLNAQNLEKTRNANRPYKPSAEELKNKEKALGYNNALKTISKMEDINKKGNLGIGTSFRQAIDPDARRDAGEYEILGKSLISFVSDIPIRNKVEFEEMAHSLYDPSLSDAKRKGILDGLRFRLEEALGEYSQNPESTDQDRPPLESFMR
jgi:hypothetical protein